ncbi:MAG: hypothetical protein JO185_20015 [Acidobacteriaceae bacterium]|nr:hypothetical protein [Acidobacteriaceae bacterium]
MTSVFHPSPELHQDFRRLFLPALGIGIGLSIVSLIGLFFSPGDFFRSYLLGYLFWLGLTLGSLGIVMMQYLTGGAWGIMTRRTLESATRTLPLLALLFIPVAIGIPHLYDWAHPNLVQREYVLHHRTIYMNTPMFIVRAVIYFVIWGVFAYFLNKWSAEQDERGGFEKRLAALSAPGLILYVFTVTFSAVDWAESLETDWYSTMWGFLFVASQGLAAFAFVMIVIALLARREPLASRFKPSHLHDLGKLLLTFVMLWAYFAFSQLLIVWSGNLTDEIPWYLRRFATSWGWLGIALIVFQFIVPFLLLLSRPLKRNVIALSCVVGLIIVMRFVDLMWIVMPGYYQHGLRIHWLNFSVPLGLGGLWIATFIWQLKNRPLLPVNAPSLEKALQHGDD